MSPQDLEITIRALHYSAISLCVMIFLQITYYFFRVCLTPQKARNQKTCHFIWIILGEIIGIAVTFGLAFLFLISTLTLCIKIIISVCITIPILAFFAYTKENGTKYFFLK